jgi:triacylglycerol lipase
VEKNMRAITFGLSALLLVLFSNTSLAWWGYTKTKHPILLVHGVSGWDSLGNIVDYFYRVPYSLQKDGAKVCVSALSSFASSFDRAASLAPQVKNCAQQYGTGKVNIFAHSQGSPTARILLNYGDSKNYIASITSINGVNKGSKVADFLRGVIPPGSVLETTVANVANAIGNLVDAISSNGQNFSQHSIDALETLTTEGSNSVNNYSPWGINTSSYCAKSSETHNIGGNSIKLFSWTGNDATTNILDISDGFLYLTSKVFGSEKNDGLVGVCSSYLGNVIGDNYQLNHMDAVNHVFGIHGWTEPLSLYTKHANRLKGKGL